MAQRPPIQTLLKSLARPTIVDFKRPTPIVIDPVRGVPATVGGHPSWITTGRSRPRYFDGRFLAARDLQRDQDYFAGRQADHLRAAGQGVIHGLDVSAKDQTTLVVEPGAAITPSGQLVVLRTELELPLADSADTQRLDDDFRLLRSPRDVARRRTGVFVLLARPVTYTADPIGLYPQSIDQRRAPEDGDVIDAVAFSLAPYHDRAIDVDPAHQRAAVARRIFVEKAELGAPVEAVPLALVQLERGFVRWVDEWLVRREIGAAHEGVGVGASVRAARALAEAHVQQYHRQLGAIASDRQAAGKSAGFTAAEELAALPPVGAFPLASLDLANEAERFFPQAVPATLEVVPDDEIATILDELLAMPPIDLAATDAALAATPVCVLLPVPRATAETLPAALRSFPLRATAASPGRARARDAVLLSSLAARFAAIPLTDDRGSRLAAAVGTVTTAYYARLRRALGATGDGVVTIDHQAGG